MATVFLSLGSNLGDRQANLVKALELLAKFIAQITASPLYETDPWNAPSHPQYLNLCIRGETDIVPFNLLAICKNIEQKLGRDFLSKPSSKLSKTPEPRTLDIDMLFYNNLILESDVLTIPHPRLHVRRFVLQPLSDIAPDFIHPVFQKTIAELLRECGDQSEVH